MSEMNESSLPNRQTKERMYGYIHAKIRILTESALAKIPRMGEYLVALTDPIYNRDLSERLRRIAPWQRMLALLTDDTLTCEQIRLMMVDARPVELAQYAEGYDYLREQMGFLLRSILSCKRDHTHMKQVRCRGKMIHYS